MQIWKTPLTPEDLNSVGRNTIHQSLGIEFIEIGENYIEAKMPVDQRTHQPAGLLHGGASVVLSESLGSMASLLVAGVHDSICVGLEVSASHLNSIKTGSVIGRVTPIRLGKTIHVWEIRIRNSNSSDSQDQLICHSKLTVLVKEKKKN